MTCHCVCVADVDNPDDMYKSDLYMAYSSSSMTSVKVTANEQAYYTVRSNQVLQRILPENITQHVVKAFNFHMKFEPLANARSVVLPLSSMLPVFQTLNQKTLVTTNMCDGVVYIHWIGANGTYHATFVTHGDKKVPPMLIWNSMQEYELEYSMRNVSELVITMGVLDLHICARCGASGSHKKCAQCSDVCTRYCSKECQITHWRIHKKFCERNK